MKESKIIWDKSPKKTGIIEVINEIWNVLNFQIENMIKINTTNNTFLFTNKIAIKSTISEIATILALKRFNSNNNWEAKNNINQIAKLWSIIPKNEWVNPLWDEKKNIKLMTIITIPK